jgi:hypothetical protein
MDTLAYPIFSIMSEFFRTAFFKIMDEGYLRMVKSIVSIAVVIETFVIMRNGYIIMGRKSTEDEKNPDLEELLYHALVVCGTIAFLKTDTGPLDFLLGIKTMLIEGLTGSPTPGGKQVAESLLRMDTAFSFGNLYNSTSLSNSGGGIKSTLITISLTSQVSPQLVAGLLMMFNEMMVRVGIALFPMVAYAALYKTTRDIFMTWLGLMLSLGILMAACAVTTKLAAEVTVAFVLGFGGMLVAQRLLPPGSPTISELQQSLIQGGFGFTIMVMLLQYPINVANFAGSYLNFSGPTTNNELGALYQNKSRKYSKR